MTERLFHEIMCPSLTKTGPCNCTPAIVVDGKGYGEASDLLAWLNLEQKKAERWGYSATGVYRFQLTGPELMRLRHALESMHPAAASVATEAPQPPNGVERRTKCRCPLAGHLKGCTFVASEAPPPQTEEQMDAEEFLRSRADPAKCHGDVRAYTYAEVLELLTNFRSAPPEPSRLRALVKAWREKAASIDDFHATMATGWHVCADELEMLLNESPGGTRKDAPDQSDPSTGPSTSRGEA